MATKETVDLDQCDGKEVCIYILLNVAKMYIYIYSSSCGPAVWWIDKLIY